jgi:hypothetical protein
VALFTPLCRRDPLARFLAMATLLSVVPICSTFPADRLLFFTGVGAMGLIALWLERSPRRGAYWPAAIALLLVHGVLAPPLLAFRAARALTPVERPVVRADQSLPSTAELAGRTLVLVNPVADFIPSYVWLMRSTAGQPMPRLRWLATGTSAVSLLREDARTLRVRPQHGFVASESEQLLRDPVRHAFAPGDVIQLDGLRIEVTDALPDGRPAEVRARFDRSLDDPSLCWAAWDRTAFKPFVPPAVGQRIELPPVSAVEALFPQVARWMQ